MKLHADFAKRAQWDTHAMKWIASPAVGVERKMLDRIGEEKARATSIVRYTSNSSFPEHEHPMGEEFLILKGVFSDEHGDYPQGSYVRNPPGSGHILRSERGCRILVKLRQFDPTDLKQFSVDTADEDVWPAVALDTITKLHLHSFESERVEMWRIPQATSASELTPLGGLELFVVQGSVRVDQCQFAANSWLRFPPGARSDLYVGEDTLLWVKSGHLPIGN